MDERRCDREGSRTLRARAVAALLALLAMEPWGLSSGSAQVEPAAAAPARRIVSLAPSATEILFAIGAGDRLVGVCSFCDHPAGVAAVPRVGTFTSPSIEAIVAARPDLVIGARGPATVGAVAAVGRLGVPVLLVEDTTLDAVWTAIAEIGRRTGREDAAAALASELRGRLDRVRARLAGVAPRRVLVVVGQTPLIVAGVGTFVDDLIHVAGGVNVAADTGQPWPRLSIETVLARAPEVIIDTALDHEEGADRGLWDRFPTLPAVRDSRVHAYGSFAALRGGPRLAEAAEDFARLIHPEIEGPPDRPGRDVMPGPSSQRIDATEPSPRVARRAGPAR
jgi:iron complex transport system substrate-binding protein